MTLKPSAAEACTLVWIKSSYSTNDGPECVEVAATTAAVRIRDSKKVQGPQLAVTHGAWANFVAHTVVA